MQPCIHDTEKLLKTPELEELPEGFETYVSEYCKYTTNYIIWVNKIRKNKAQLQSEKDFRITSLMKIKLERGTRVLAAILVEHVTINRDFIAIIAALDVQKPYDGLRINLTELDLLTNLIWWISSFLTDYTAKIKFTAALSAKIEHEHRKDLQWAQPFITYTSETAPNRRRT